MHLAFFLGEYPFTVQTDSGVLTVFETLKIFDFQGGTRTFKNEIKTRLGL